METTRTIIRKQFAAIGYKVSFKRNPFNSNLCSLAWKDDVMLKPQEMSSCNCYGSEFITKHQAAFTLSNSLKNYILTDTDQKIVS